MTELSCDPYEGAARAFFALNPDCSSQDFENWLARNCREAQGEFDDFKALARLCREARTANVHLEQEVSGLIAYACGFFEATGRVMNSLLASLPTSEHVPHHYSRYRRILVDAASQFEE